MNAPKVSVIVPSYNYERYLREALDSILGQTFTDWELLVFDDGSQDSSWEIINDYVLKDSRIQAYQHAGAVNLGLSATLKSALARAKAPLIAFLEADDFWYPLALQQKVEIMQRNTQAAMVFSLPEILQQSNRELKYYNYIFSILNKIHAYRNPSRVYCHELLAINLVPSFSCVMARREVLLACSFGCPFGPLLDKWLWQQMSAMGECLFMPTIDVAWRFHDGSYMDRERSEDHPSHQIFFEKETTKLIMPICRQNHLFLLMLFLLCGKFSKFVVRILLKLKTRTFKSWKALLHFL